MSVEHTPDAPPPLDLDAVREARKVVDSMGGHRDAYIGVDLESGYLVVADLLGAYDVLAARHSIFAARFAELHAVERARRVSDPDHADRLANGAYDR